LYVPEKGELIYDDTPASQRDLRSIRRQIGVVPQSAFLFADSIHNNITLSDSRISREAVIHAARQACVHDDIMAMPMGYQTVLSDRGSSLSGGQRQRLALARALARNPKLLVLDEATSALDALTEQEIQRVLDELHCTRIIVAHRLSTVAQSDLIVVLDQGRIVEMGKHQKLLEKKGFYANLVEAQMQNSQSITPAEKLFQD
jgi:ATP-binding cassette, subfamily B, bacterial